MNDNTKHYVLVVVLVLILLVYRISISISVSIRNVRSSMNITRIIDSVVSVIVTCMI